MIPLCAWFADWKWKVNQINSLKSSKASLCFIHNRHKQAVEYALILSSFLQCWRVIVWRSAWQPQTPRTRSHHLHSDRLPAWCCPRFVHFGQRRAHYRRLTWALPWWSNCFHLCLSLRRRPVDSNFTGARLCGKRPWWTPCNQSVHLRSHPWLVASLAYRPHLARTAAPCLACQPRVHRMREHHRNWCRALRTSHATLTYPESSPTSWQWLSRYPIGKP